MGRNKVDKLKIACLQKQWGNLQNMQTQNFLEEMDQITMKISVITFKHLHLVIIILKEDSEIIAIITSVKIKEQVRMFH
jgi:hypothetical protein